MCPNQLPDACPVVVLFGLIAVTLLVAFEGGYRVGRLWQGKTPEEKEGPTSSSSARA
jgi:hypothetical protein